MKIGLLTFLFLLATLPTAFGQLYKLSGKITDSKSNEAIFGATLLLKDTLNDAVVIGAKSDLNGKYSLKVAAGEYQINIRASGFQAKTFNILITEDKELNLSLDSDKIEQIEEVIVSSVKENNNVTKSGMNVTTLTPKDIETIPVIFGEKDILKILQLTPGVKSAGEGQAGFYVRGGAADQNLVLIDDAPVFNPSHLLGFFSVFNSDVVKEASLHKAAIPAEYGGRASSVLDVKMREGNDQKFQASGGIGLISSRLAIEGPIVKNRGSFIIAGRRSYADIFLKLSKDKAIRDASLYFYDLNLKANYRITDKDRIYLSGYFGKDNFGYGKMFGFNWSNLTGTLRWNRIINERFFSNTSVIYSKFFYGFGMNVEDLSFKLNASIQDFNLKQDFQYRINKNNVLKFGANGIHHTFFPGHLSTKGFVNSDLTLSNKFAIEVGAYIQNEQTIGNRWNLMYGLRYAGFNFMGKGKAYTYNEEGKVDSETEYSNWKSIKYYQVLEPRMSVAFLLTEMNSIKLGYNRNSQFMHQLSNSTAGSPTDTWIPSSNNVKPQIADQVALGYYHNFKNNMFQASVEVYYKHLSNLIDYRNGASLMLNEHVEGELLFGRGKAYGVEFLIEKKKGRFTGWVSYTLSRSLRQFDAINGGKAFSARQDRIHDIAVVGMFRASKAIALSSSFVYYTGDAVTFPAGKYTIDGTTMPMYAERNGQRMPNYHRLDFGLTWYFKERPKFEHNLNFSIYNIYARQNAYMISFEQSENDPEKTVAIQTSLFRFIPSITYNFKFK